MITGRAGTRGRDFVPIYPCDMYDRINIKKYMVIGIPDFSRQLVLFIFIKKILELKTAEIVYL